MKRWFIQGGKITYFTSFLIVAAMAGSFLYLLHSRSRGWLQVSFLMAGVGIAIVGVAAAVMELLGTSERAAVAAPSALSRC